MLPNSTQHVCLKGLAAAVLCASAVGATAAKPQLVLVIDKAQVPAAVLAEAEEEVVRVFDKAGIQLRLLDCSSAPGMAQCDNFMDQHPLFLRVLPTRPVTLST